MNNFSLKHSFNSSLKTSILVLKLIIPMYILAEILFYYNILSYISFIVEPITSIIGLPPEAALSIISGLFLSEYAAVAFAAPLDLSVHQWSILAVFTGVAHALLVEGMIMKKIGISNFYSYSIRIGFAFILAYITYLMPESWFASDIFSFAQEKISYTQYANIFELLETSFVNAFILCFKVILLVSIIIFILDFIKTRSFINPESNKVSKWYSMGTGYILGITYGAGVLINEAKSGNMSRSDIFYVSTFLLICHAIIEDTLLFVILGANFTMVVLIRTVAAIIIAYFMLFLYDRFQVVQKASNCKSSI